MALTITELPNSKIDIQQRLREGLITWGWPLTMVFARLIFAFLAQAFVAGLYMLRGHVNPWQAAAPWWIVYGTLIDLGCLILLIRLTRREGIRLGDLIGFQNQQLGRTVLLGLGFIVLYLALAMTGGIITEILIYGTVRAPAVMMPLPFWGTLYSLVVWPLIWAFAEEMTYQGYALPWMPDWRWALYRFGSSLLIGMVLPIIYLRTRRLAPFIIAHWAANFVAVLMTVEFPMATI
jgi:hypothetical protein